MSIGAAESDVQTEYVPVAVPLVHREYKPSSLSAEECLRIAREFYGRQCAMLEKTGRKTNLHVPFAGFVDDEHLEQ
ncbi:MAG TPA: hypothetical protein VJB60_01390 [Candidatus Peribacterales bacterium]|nr:hypothetical protein [Candidatus Peribacterales bacterium]